MDGTFQWMGMDVNRFKLNKYISDLFFCRKSETKVWGTAMTLCWNIYNQTS